MKKYHVAVDVTRSIDVFIDAENMEQAENLAVIEADLNSTIGAGAWVKSEVHFIAEKACEYITFDKNGDNV